MKMKTTEMEMGMGNTEALKMLLRFLNNHKRKSSSAGCNKKAFTIKRNADQTACLLIVKKTTFHPSANLQNKGSSSVKPFHVPSFGNQPPAQISERHFLRAERGRHRGGRELRV